LKCPRCGLEMYYRTETERIGNGARRVVSYYKCPVCGYKVGDCVIDVQVSSTSVKLVVAKQS